ncbi:MAG: ABC transporter substrate binding protein [Marinifilaceae bacterium]
MMRCFRVVLLLIFLFHSMLSFASARKRILVLHSYHQGLQWTDNVNKGIQEVLESLVQVPEIDYEYLDTKRNPTEEYLQKLIELYDTKLDKRQYNAIIVSDNNALAFVRNHRKEYFQDIPVVFCGVNHFRPEMIKGMKAVTGVAEAVDLQGTVEMIHQTQPNIKSLVVVNDDKTTTALLNKQLIAQVEQNFKGQLDFHYYEDLFLEDLVSNVEKIRGDTAILLLTFNKDKSGKFVSFQENIDLLVPRSKVPVFIAWDFHMAEGVVGGKVVSGRLHGKAAAGMVVKILQGVQADSIPLMTEPLDYYLMNYQELQRFGIDEKKLPPHTILVNAPRSFYSENKKWIQLIFSILAVAGGIIIILSRAIIRRMHAEEALLVEQNHLEESVKHEQLMGKVARLLNSTNDFKNVLDEVLTLMTEELNVAKISLFSFSDQEETGIKIRSRISVKGQDIKDVNELYFSQIASVVDRIKNNQSLVSSDLSGLSDQEREYYHNRNIKAIVALPVRVENRIMGLMGFAQNDEYKWSRDEINIFRTTVNMLANAWERNALTDARLDAEQKNVEALRMLEESSRLASIGVMAAGITHEINQPLNAIKITADSVLFWQKRNPDVLPEMFTRKIKTISEGTARIDSIIKHMRTFWENPQTNSGEKVEMVDGVRRALSLVKRQVFDHSIELIEDLPDSEIVVEANYMQFEQIVINLLVNAIHSLDQVKKDKKIIRLEVFQKGQKGILKIHDNGTGIPEQLGDKIYDPFFSTKRPGDGTGLGMAIVKSFMDRFHAQIQNYNNREGGASFVLEFNCCSNV